jgi:threonine dehydrogenase-like Zn-dependent dehydrogenase
MGVLAALAARAYGAYPVLMSGMTPHRMEMARQYFADVVIDANQADVAEEVKQRTGGRGADAVIVTVSSAQALETGLGCVRPGGVVNAFAGVPEGTTIALDVRRLHYQQYTLTGSFGTAPEYMAKAMRLLEHRKVDGSLVVTACFPFPMVEEAVAYAEQRRGLKAVVTF